MHGFYRLAAAVPKLNVAVVDYNVSQILLEIKEAQASKPAALVFPELSLTGYTCGDLFFQPRLLNAALEGVQQILKQTSHLTTIIVVGVPFRYQDAVYNTAFVLQKGKILGVVPKSVLPNYREFYEKRQFVAAKNPRHDATVPRTICILGQKVLFGVRMIFGAHDSWFRFAIELCEGLWTVLPPSSQPCLAGATAMFTNPAATELTGMSDSLW